MLKDSSRNHRLIALFLLGCLLLNYPLLSLFNLPRTVFGWPLLYAYLFGVWIILILLVMFVTRSTDLETIDHLEIKGD